MTATKKATKRTFQAIAAKAIEMGLNESKIEVAKDSVTFWKDDNDDVWSDDLQDWVSHTDQIISRLSEFFVDYRFSYSGNHYQTRIENSNGYENSTYELIRQNID